MRKRFLAICLISVILIAVLVPSCESAEEGGTIIVKATLCDATWEGVVNFTLTESEGNIINPGGATPIGITYEEVRSGFYTADFLDGGPPEAILVSIVPAESQAVTSGGTVTFTLNFELEQDASIEFLTWTMNGQNVTPNTPQTPYTVEQGDIIDVHYAQHVAGCQGKEVAVNETSELSIHYTDGQDPASVFVANNWCAVVKEPEPIEKVSQVSSFNGEPVQPGGGVWPPTLPARHTGCRNNLAVGEMH